MCQPLSETIEQMWLIAGFGPATYGLPNGSAIRHMLYASLQRLCRHEVCESWAVSGKGKKLQLLN